MIQQIPISQIVANPFQSRSDLGDVTELAQEIKQQGLWQPLRARKSGAKYELVFGHRRLEAVKKNGEKQVEVEIVDLDDVDMAMQSLVENVQREDLSALDRGEALKKLVSLATKKFGDEGKAKKFVEEKIGLKTRSWFNTLLQISALPPQTKKVLGTDLARGLAPITALKAHTYGGTKMVARAAKEGWSQHQIEKVIQTAKIKKQAAMTVKEIEDVIEKISQQAKNLEDTLTSLMKFKKDFHANSHWKGLQHGLGKVTKAVEDFQKL